MVGNLLCRVRVKTRKTMGSEAKSTGSERKREERRGPVPTCSGPRENVDNHGGRGQICRVRGKTRKTTWSVAKRRGSVGKREKPRGPMKQRYVRCVGPRTCSGPRENAKNHGVRGQICRVQGQTWKTTWFGRKRRGSEGKREKPRGPEEINVTWERRTHDMLGSGGKREKTRGPSENPRGPRQNAKNHGSAPQRWVTGPRTWPGPRENGKNHGSRDKSYVVWAVGPGGSPGPGKNAKNHGVRPQKKCAMNLTDWKPGS